MIRRKHIAEPERGVAHDRKIEVVERLGDGQAAETAEGEDAITKRIGDRINPNLDEMRCGYHKNDDQDTHTSGHRDARHATGQPTQNRIMK